jgi:hypothetical protein
MKHYQASLYPLTFFLHLMQVIITGYFNELDLSYADSNEFLSKSRRAGFIISPLEVHRDIRGEKRASSFCQMVTII